MFISIRVFCTIPSNGDTSLGHIPSLHIPLTLLYLQALDAVLTKQKQRLLLQLNEKKMRKDCQVYEHDVAAQMVLKAKLNEEQLAETKAGKKGHNQELVGSSRYFSCW